MRLNKLFLLIAVLFLLGCNNPVYKIDLVSYFNKGDFTIDELLVVDIFGGFGDGYSVETYSITGTDIKSYIFFKP